MKILNLTEFFALPAGIIFSYYEPNICGALFRKGNTIFDADKPIDYFETSLIPVSKDYEQPPTLDGTESRWGEYEPTQLYAVLEPADIETLRSLLPTP